MKIGIIHYHLNRGGVAQVVRNHLHALNTQSSSDVLQVALIHGGRHSGWSEELMSGLLQLDISMHAVDELDYDNVRPSRGKLAVQLESTLRDAGFKPSETVLHVHNHSLGKNSEMLGVLRELACAGYGLLLHIHDFCEDFRPENYLALTAALDPETFDDIPDMIYPQASRIHYAVLNERDYSIMTDAGLQPSRLHLIPNPVADIGPLPARDPARMKLADRFDIPPSHRYMLYPVRGIRRKNLGEALLWSALADHETSFGLTLSPLNPVEQTSFVRWTELASQLGLPWSFGVGEAMGVDYLENLSAADFILSTSVAEGFGLAFLESWLAGRTIVGRDLPDITAGFADAGLRFPSLNSKLRVPIKWLNEDEFREQFTDAYAGVLATYGQTSVSRDAIGRATDGLIQDGLVDFAHCGSSLQRLVVERVAKIPTDRQRVLTINPWIERAMQDVDASLISRNAEIVRTQFSIASCGARLLDIYRQVVTSDRGDQLQAPAHGHRILRHFLDPSHFHPVRVET